MADIHFNKITELMGDDKEMLIEMLAVFLEDIPVSINEIVEAWENKEYEKLKAPAHKLKSSITWLNLMEAHESMKFLEHFAQHGGDEKEAEKHVNTAKNDCNEALVIIAEKLKEIKD
jgi:HPt (histidine-containing phosphotransfer) domain-containing protein